MLSRNCQTTTKDLAKDIIRREHFNSKFAWPLDTVDFITKSLRSCIVVVLLLFAMCLCGSVPAPPSFWDLSLEGMLAVLYFGLQGLCLVHEYGFALLIPGVFVLMLFGLLIWIAYKTIGIVAHVISQCARVPSWLWRQWSRFQGSFPKMWFRLDRV